MNAPDPNQPLVESEVEDECLDFFTEIATSLIYEARFFENFVIVRPVSPAFYSGICKLDLATFANTFEDFYGDRQQVLAYIKSFGTECDALIIEDD